MTNPTARTRRQLREALNRSVDKEVELEGKLREANVAKDFEKQENSRLRTDLARAESALTKIGYKRSIERSIAVDLGIALPHEEWQPKQGLTPTLTAAEHDKVINQRVGEAVDATRRSALASVLNALEIKGYERHGYPKVTKLGAIEQVTLGHDTDRFWADIQTALEVREEKRAADERDATEKKVARLAPAQQLSFYYPRIGFDAASPRVSDLVGGIRFGTDATWSTEPAATREDVDQVRKLADDLGGKNNTDAFAETVEKLSYGSAPKVDETKPTIDLSKESVQQIADSLAEGISKPAKKKSEGKK